MPLMRLQTLLGWPMLSTLANQGLVAVVLRFISRAIRTLHSAAPSNYNRGRRAMTSPHYRLAAAAIFKL